MTDAEKIELLRVTLRDITYLSIHDLNALDRARGLAYAALTAAGLIPPRGNFESHGKVGEVHGNEPDSPALFEAKERMKQRTSADLIESVDRTGYYAQPGPLKNRLEWQELCRRLLEP